jgi:hypothetical protein
MTTPSTSRPPQPRFAPGDTVVFSAAAHKVKNWGGGGRGPDRKVHTVSHYIGRAFDLVLDGGLTWNQCWLELATPADPELTKTERDSLDRGLAESAAGDTVDLGGFAEYPAGR